MADSEDRADMVSSPRACPFCGQQIPLDEGRCAACGAVLRSAATAGEDDPSFSTGQPGTPFPTTVKIAGIVWTAFGFLALLGISLQLLLFFPSGLATDADLYRLCVLLAALPIAALFVHVGIQTRKGTALDTLGNALGSIAIGVFGLGWAIRLIIAYAGAGSGTKAGIAEVVGAVNGATLVMAGVLAILGRDNYRAWRLHRREQLAKRGTPVGEYSSVNNQEAAQLVVPIRRSFLAMGAFYIGLLCFVPCYGGVFAPFAIAFGIAALAALRRNPGLVGKGGAIFGLVVGLTVGLGNLAALIFFVIMRK